MKNNEISTQNNQHQINFKSLNVRGIKKSTHYIQLSVRDYDVDKSISDRRYVNDLPVGDYAIIFNLYNKTEHDIDYSLSFIKELSLLNNKG